MVSHNSHKALETINAQPKRSVKKNNVDDQIKPKHHRYYATAKIKEKRFKTTITQAQTELSPFNKSISVIIHKRFIYDLGELIANTFARPITLCLSGLSTLIIGLIIIYWGKHFGFYYPDSLLVMIFVVTYPFSLIIDLTFSTIRRLVKKPPKG